jgi:hypothetical protein
MYWRMKIMIVGESYVRGCFTFWYIYYMWFSNPKNRDTKPFSVRKNELQYHSWSYNVACLMLPATLNSVEFQTERHQRMLWHVILLSVNAASTLVSPQNKLGLKLNYYKQPMWYSEFKPLHHMLLNTQSPPLSDAYRHTNKNHSLTAYFTDYILHKNSSNNVQSSFMFIPKLSSSSINI